MRLARVRGKVVSSMKAAGLSSYKLLLVQDVHPEHPSEDDSSEGAGAVYIAIDLAGAGDDEIVIIATGSAARVYPGGADVPTDAAVVGIVDCVQYSGQITYVKH